MKILIISPFFPYPTDSGGKTRLYNLIKKMSATHEITLLCLILKNDINYIDQLTPFCHPEPVEIEPMNERKIWGKEFWLNTFLRIRAISQGLPVSLAGFMNNRFKNQLDLLLKNNEYDIVQFEYSQMAGYAKQLPKNTIKVLSIIELVQITAARQRQIATGLKKQYYRLDHYFKKRFEKTILYQFNAVLALSENDREIITGIAPNAKVFIIPNGVSRSLLSIQPKHQTGPRLLFIGGTSHRPNVDGLSFFLAKCWPGLKQQFPQLRLRVIGRGWHKYGWLANNDAIKITDYVEKLTDCYRDATLFIAPIRIGSGTRLKILEAMAAGLPVVSTAIGCEGLSVENGRQLLIADEPEAIVKAIAALLTNNKLALKLGAEARRHIEADFLWPAITDQLNLAYEKLLKLNKGEIYV